MKRQQVAVTAPTTPHDIHMHSATKLSSTKSHQSVEKASQAKAAAAATGDPARPSQGLSCTTMAGSFGASLMYDSVTCICINVSSCF